MYKSHRERCMARVRLEGAQLLLGIPIPYHAPDTITYERIGLIPPPDQQYYKRKSDDLTSDDAWSFIHIWEPCPQHMVTQIVGFKNQLILQHTCALDYSIISPIRCETCPHRVEPQIKSTPSLKIKITDEFITYEKEQDWEPPRDINGYQRDPDNAWKFTSLWPQCTDRIQETKKFSACGCIDIIMTCKNPQCQYSDKVVTHLNCQECPHRIERKCNV